MPQLEFASYPPQIVWFIGVFVLFWFIMDKFIIPKTREMVENRKLKYDSLLLKAEEYNKKALQLFNDYENKMAVAKKEIADRISITEKEVAETIASREKLLSKMLNNKIAENKEILNQNKIDLLFEVDDIAKVIAYSIIEQLNLKKITKDDISKTSNNVD